MAHELLYRFGVVAHLITVSTNVPPALIFYDLFKVVNRRLAVLVAFFTLVATAVEAANLLNQFAPLILLADGTYLSAFNPDQLQALAYVSLDAQVISYDIQRVIYAGYLLAAGDLVFRSTFLPRTVGVLPAIGAVCYLTYSLSAFVASGFANHLVPYIQLPSGVAELSLCLCLLVMGVNEQRWKEQTESI